MYWNNISGNWLFPFGMSGFVKKLPCFGLLILSVWPITDIAGKGKKIQGFEVGNAIIPRSEIRSGGAAKDAIPSIDLPKFVGPEEVSLIGDKELVISVTSGGETRAYPLRILNWHEVVNDHIGDDYFAVTYCPLCRTAMVFDRKFGKDILSFGVSGLLYNSDALFYDRQTESLWSQIAMKAVSGPLVGSKLNWRASETMNWASWKRKYPEGKVLSFDTSFDRQYSVSPYAEYVKSDALMFPVSFKRKELPKKTLMIGLLVGEQAKAYQLSYFPADEYITDVVGGKNIKLFFNLKDFQIKANYTDTSEEIPTVLVYWFAWQAFYPDTEVWGKLKDSSGKKKLNKIKPPVNF